LEVGSIWCRSLKKWPLQAKLSSPRNRGKHKATRTTLCPQLASKLKVITSTAARAKGRSIHEPAIKATPNLFILEGEEL